MYRTPLLYVCGYMIIQILFFTIKSMVFWILKKLTKKTHHLLFGIQSDWQQQIMARFGHNYAIAIDATFGTTQTRVCLIYILILYCNYC
jgi:hypothetical protein